MILSARTIERLKPKPKPYRVVDAALGYLQVQVSPKGNKTWVFAYRENGKRRFNKIGSFPATELNTARNRAMELQKKIESGETIKTSKAANSEDKLPTVNSLLDDYITDCESREVKTIYYIERMLDTRVRPIIGEMIASDVVTSDITKILRPSVKTAPTQSVSA